MIPTRGELYLNNCKRNNYISQSLLKCFLIGIISVPLPLYIALNISGWQGFLACLGAFFCMFAPSALFVGLSKNERNKAVKWVREKF